MKKIFKKLLSDFSSNLKTCRSVSLLTWLLVCFFGMGSWVAINGIWAELPILLVTQPECYQLAAVLSVTIQLANVGPLVYTIAKVIWSSRRYKVIYLEIIGVYTIVGIGLIATGLMSFFWSETAYIGGENHSIVLIILAFFLALVDCTSSVIFIPFMKHFPAIYLSSLYIGEGLSGVIPSALALVQGSVNDSVHCKPGHENYIGINRLGIRYSPQVYFLLLAFIVLLCGLSFTGLLVMKRKKKRTPDINAISSTTTSDDEDDADDNKSDRLMINCSSDEDCLIREKEEEEEINEEEKEPKERDDNEQDDQRERRVKRFRIEKLKCHESRSFLGQLVFISWKQRTPLVCTILLGFITNGSLNSISAYAFGHYGNSVLHLALLLGLLANPIGSFVYSLVSCRSRMVIVVFTSAVAILSLYIMVHSMLRSDSVVPGTTGSVIIVS